MLPFTKMVNLGMAGLGGKDRNNTVILVCNYKLVFQSTMNGQNRGSQGSKLRDSP